MNNRDKEEIIRRYRDRLSSYGQSIEALASGTTERRDIRFSTLKSVGNLEGKKVLDLGCGFGDFYAWLKGQGMDVLYTGYDISPELIQVCNDRFPGSRFEVRDIQETGIPEKFDYIVCSQAFNNRLSEDSNIKTMKDIISVCFEACNEGLAIDMLTSYVDFREPHLFYYSPEDMFSFAKSLTKRVALRHDYPAYEFALFLYSDFNGWAN